MRGKERESQDRRGRHTNDKEWTGYMNLPIYNHVITCGNCGCIEYIHTYTLAFST